MVFVFSRKNNLTVNKAHQKIRPTKNWEMGSLNIAGCIIEITNGGYDAIKLGNGY